MGSIEALLFDMNGVLVDSEDFLPFVGMGENRFISGVAEKYGADFDAVVDWLSVERRKPFPDIYLEAAGADYFAPDLASADRTILD